VIARQKAPYLLELSCATIVHAIRQYRIILQQMRNYSVYACAVTFRIVVCFATLSFVYRFEFLPFMVLVIALLNTGTIITLSDNHVLPSLLPDAWNLSEIIAYAIVYGMCLTASTSVSLFYTVFQC
jgi:H+-transporting ATPase